MGYFSWNCERCGKSLRSPDTESSPKWMTQGIAILKTGGIASGTYNGFGVIDQTVIDDAEPTIYHKMCWENAGLPSDWTGESERADDQGFFIPCCEECGCNMEDDPFPGLCYDCECLIDEEETCDLCGDYIADCPCGEIYHD